MENTKNKKIIIGIIIAVVVLVIAAITTVIVINNSFKGQLKSEWLDSEGNHMYFNNDGNVFSSEWIETDALLGIKKEIAGSYKLDLFNNLTVTFKDSTSNYKYGSGAKTGDKSMWYIEGDTLYINGWKLKKS